MPTSMIDAVKNGSHVIPVRVYYEDTDAAGIVYYANYLKFAERARSELMRDIGDQLYRRMLEDGMHFVVRRCVVDYLGVARLDDLLEVHSRMRVLRGASLSAEQIIRRGDQDLVTMEVELACLGPGGRPARIPDELRTALTRYVSAIAEP